MTAKDAMEAFVGSEHSEENWLKAWPLLRKGTALEPHGVELISVNDDEILLSMEIGPHAHQPFGLLHGGISMLLAESAASMHSCWKLDLPTEFPVGIEINGSHIRGASEGLVHVLGRVIRRSRTLVHHQVEIIEVESKTILSTIRVTNLIRRSK